MKKYYIMENQFVKGHFYTDDCSTFLFYVGERNQYLHTFHAAKYDEEKDMFVETDNVIYLTHAEASGLHE